MLKYLRKTVPLLLALSLSLLTPSEAADSKDLLAPTPYQFISLSPDGNHVAAYLAGGGENRKILVIDTDKFKTTRVSVSDGKGGSADVTDLRWIDNQHLAIISNGDDNTKWLHTFKIGDRFPERLSKDGTNTLVHMLPNSPRFLVAEQIPADDSQNCRLLEYDVATKAEPKTLLSLKSKTFQCVANSQGTLRMLKRDDGDGSNTAWYNVDPNYGEQRKLSSLQQWNKVHGIVGTTNHAIVSGQINTALPSIYVFNLNTDETLQVLADQPQYSIDTYGQTVFDPSAGKVLGLHLDAVERQSFWTDGEMNKLQAAIDAELAGTVNRILSWNTDRSQVLVERYIATLPTQYLHFDVKKKKFSAVVVNGPPVKPNDTGRTRLIDIPNRDGNNMTAILTLPNGVSPEKLPLMIWLRNGLWDGLDRAEWHPEANFFAAEGFAVLRLNYSGSEGLIGPFAVDKNQADGVRKTFSDIEDATQALVAAGLVDPQKICIGGEGVAAWGAAYAPIANPNRYQAVLSINGVYDLVEYREASKGNNEMNGGMNFGFANHDSPLSDAEVLSFSIPQNLANYPKNVFVTLGKWSPLPYKNHVQEFIKSLKKERISVKNETGDWYAAQMNDTQKIEAFTRAASLAKSAVK